MSDYLDGVTFEAFIVKKLVPQLWDNACVVLDNAQIHLGKMVTEAIEHSWRKSYLFISLFS